MRIRLFVPFALVLAAPVCAGLAEDLIPDPGLREAIAFNIGKASSELTTDDLGNPLFTFLWAEGYSIEDLSGIESCVNLREVLLPENRIKRLEPLAHLQELEVLDISLNPYWYLGEEKEGRPPIDVAPLVQLPALQELWIGWTDIVSATPIGEIQSLELLWLKGLQEVVLLDGLRERGVTIVVGRGGSSPFARSQSEPPDRWLMDYQSAMEDDSLFLWSIVTDVTASLYTSSSMEWYTASEVCFWADRTIEETGMNLPLLREIFNEVWTSGRPVDCAGAANFIAEGWRRTHGEDQIVFGEERYNPATGKLLAQRIRLLLGYDVVRCVEVDFEQSMYWHVRWY